MVRAYATNSNGTSYGNQISFTATTSLVDSTPPLMTANTEGVQYNNLVPFAWPTTGADVFMEDQTTPLGIRKYLVLQGTDTPTTITHDDKRTIELYIPITKFAPGTYPISYDYGFESNMCEAFISFHNDPQRGSSLYDGTITITEFNTTTKRIKGTFQFSYEKFNEYDEWIGDYTLTGTFNYGLDDPYFD